MGFSKAEEKKKKSFLSVDDSAVRAVIMSASQEVYIVEIVYSDGLMT